MRQLHSSQPSRLVTRLIQDKPTSSKLEFLRQQRSCRRYAQAMIPHLPVSDLLPPLAGTPPLGSGSKSHLCGLRKGARPAKLKSPFTCLAVGRCEVHLTKYCHIILTSHRHSEEPVHGLCRQRQVVEALRTLLHYRGSVRQRAVVHTTSGLHDRAPAPGPAESRQVLSRQGPTIGQQGRLSTRAPVAGEFLREY
jgi:hypothetical protein